MRDEQRQLVAILNEPVARLNVEQTALFLNFQPHDIPVLVAARLLKPLGNPPPNGAKFFATVELIALSKDRYLAGESHQRHLPALARQEQPQKETRLL